MYENIKNTIIPLNDNVINDNTIIDNENIIMKFDENNEVNISLVMMVKNESKRIHVSLQSVIGFVNRIIIYDTGSTDNTIDIIKDFSVENKISLYIKFGTFIDFSTSRNVLLDFTDSILNTEFLLLMDANDELVNGENLINFCKNYTGKDTAFFIKQKWKVSHFIEYFNIRFIKAHCKWRYIGKVHEYIYSPDYDVNMNVPEIILFQDRTMDDDKSSKRFNTDEILLIEEYNENKTSRTVFYLAQTKECLHKFDEAIIYYKERYNIKGSSFDEERYQSAYKIGMLLKQIKKPFEEYSGYFLSAISISPNRIEPLIRLVEYYTSIQSWEFAYFFIEKACNMSIPNVLLFLDIECYNYYRWHLMGIIAYYVNKYKEGLFACNIAIKQRNNSIDKHNLKFYENEISTKDLNLKIQLL